MGVAGVVLAAGASERMGRSKALLDFRGLPFVVRILAVRNIQELFVRGESLGNGVQVIVAGGENEERHRRGARIAGLGFEHRHRVGVSLLEIERRRQALEGLDVLGIELERGAKFRLGVRKFLLIEQRLGQGAMEVGGIRRFDERLAVKALRLDPPL